MHQVETQRVSQRPELIGAQHTNVTSSGSVTEHQLLARAARVARQAGPAPELSDIEELSAHERARHDRVEAATFFTLMRTVIRRRGAVRGPISGDRHCSARMTWRVGNDWAMLAMRGKVSDELAADGRPNMHVIFKNACLTLVTNGDMSLTTFAAERDGTQLQVQEEYPGSEKYGGEVYELQDDARKRAIARMDTMLAAFDTKTAVLEPQMTRDLFSDRYDGVSPLYLLPGNMIEHASELRQ